jgi:hypothetical protein
MIMLYVPIRLPCAGAVALKDTSPQREGASGHVLLSELAWRMQSRSCTGHNAFSSARFTVHLRRPSMAGVLLRRVGAAARLCPSIARSYVGGPVLAFLLLLSGRLIGVLRCLHTLRTPSQDPY